MTSNSSPFLTVPADYEWLYPWLPLADEDEAFAFGKALSEFTGENIALKLHDELQRETCAKHTLHSCSTRAIAYCREDPNEVLFLTDLPDNPIACVHLTWEIEQHASFPHFDGYSNFDQWTIQMRREHEWYQARSDKA